MPPKNRAACQAARGAGAGYVKLLAAEGAGDASPDLVVDRAPLDAALKDKRWSALLIGPGLGRGERAGQQLIAALSADVPTVVDADALISLFSLRLAGRQAPIVCTPHEGELAAMEAALRLSGSGSKLERARALAGASGVRIVAKGADTVIAAPDGRVAFAPRVSSWLSTAGTGDVLAGAIASRLAAGAEPFAAACEGVWLHGEAARLAGPAFSAHALAALIRSAYAACL